MKFNSIVDVAYRLEVIKNRQDEITDSLKILDGLSMKEPQSIALKPDVKSTEKKVELNLISIFLSNDVIQQALEKELEGLELEEKRLQPIFDKANELVQNIS